MRSRLRPRARLRPRPARVREVVARAQSRLQRLRTRSVLALAAASLLLLFGFGLGPAPPALAQEAQDDPARAVEEATDTLSRLGGALWGLLPKLAIALLALAAAWILTRLVRPVTRRLSGVWERGEAAGAVATVVLWGVAVVAAIAVLVGDTRAVAGSVGILGLAISWVLQAPIESFAGWLLNSFRLYYRVGDRIAVGEVFGDVYRIDVLTTTVWEAGGPGKPVQAAQATGALVTFPNSEILRGNVVNYSRDFPYVWDEVVLGVTSDSDLRRAMEAFSQVARRSLGPEMAQAARAYRGLLARRGLDFDVSEEPQVYASPAESWTDLTVRYLVPVRTRRHWQSELLVALAEEADHPRHEGRIRGAAPVRVVRLSPS